MPNIVYLPIEPFEFRMVSNQYAPPIKSPYKTIIDIVTVADCLDAATDTVGRSYSKGKIFSDFEREVAEGAGTRYAPYFPDLFKQPLLRQDIEHLLDQGRKKQYREMFYLLKRQTS